ncbi:putative membrane protein YfcA [Pedobacter sp. UYP30]|uniref:sulfite exporter TauE/SafE family protein n=1 Tax=Pedobacter sp. UYP30 TaxID=1756400 RepID=UPI0033973108
MEVITWYILVIVFVATLVRSTFGFGESLIAVPLFSLFIPIEIAVPFSVLISIFIAAVVVAQDRKQVHFESAKWLIFFSVLGIPIGLLLLIYGNEIVVKTILGVLIILYSAYSLFSKSSFKLETDHKTWLFLCGFLSGILGGAYGLNGPPLVVYGNIRNWTAKNFRATLQAYFLPASTIGMLGYWYKGLWNSTVTHYFLISIPVIIPAIFLGRYFNHRLKDGTFLRYVYIGLICIGIILLSQSLNRQ